MVSIGYVLGVEMTKPVSFAEELNLGGRGKSQSRMNLRFRSEKLSMWCCYLHKGEVG